MRTFLYPRLAVVYVEYDKLKHTGAFDSLQSYLNKVDGTVAVYVIVNNADEGNDWRQLSDRTFCINGNNVDREFSGWQKGLEFLAQRKIDYDVVLFANEAFEAVQPSYLGNRNVNWIILKAHVLKSVVGYVDTMWEKCKIQGRSVRIWMNTNCFFMPKALLDELGNLVSVNNRSIDAYLPEEFPGNGNLFKRDAPINSIYRERIIYWLTMKWHSKFVLDESTWPIFRAKSKAILNEAMLSIRIRELKYLILPDSLPAFAFRKARGLVRKLRKIIFDGNPEPFEGCEFSKAEHINQVSWHD